MDDVTVGLPKKDLQDLRRGGFIDFEFYEKAMTYMEESGSSARAADATDLRVPGWAAQTRKAHESYT